MKELSDELKQYLTPVNIVIIATCIIIFIIEAVLYRLTGQESLTDIGALGWKQVIEGKEFYRILTYMFLHGNLSHIFNNMLVLLVVGSAVEKVLGSGKYLINYLCSGLVAGIVSVYYNMWMYNHTISVEKSPVISVGASGAIFGTVGALFWLILVNKGHLAGISMRRMILFIIFSVYAGFTASGIDNAAHVGGLFFGFISAMILYDRNKVTA